MAEGRTAETVDELMETSKFDKHVLRPPQIPEQNLAGGSDASTDA